MQNLLHCCEHLLLFFSTYRPNSFIKSALAAAVVNSFPFLKDPEPPCGYVSIFLIETHLDISHPVSLYTDQGSSHTLIQIGRHKQLAVMVDYGWSERFAV